MSHAPFIGVLSDTHGYYDPLLDDLFAGAEAIVHAGDVGAGVHDRLRRIARVTAVLGNTDEAEAFPGVPVVAEGLVLGSRFVACHIRERLFARRDPVAEGFALVVVGHSHRATVERRGATLLLNPGSAGRARFGLPRTAAIVTLEDGLLVPRIVPLE